MRSLCRLELRRLCARLRRNAWAASEQRTRPRPHDPARARTNVEPPERHRSRLRRRRPRRRQHLLRRAHRACASTERAADRASVPVRLRSDRRQPRSPSTRQPSPPLARNWHRSRPTRKAAGANCSSTHRSKTDCPTSASSAPTTRDALGAVGPAARASGVAYDARAHAAGLAYNGFAPVAPRRVAGDVQARLEQRAVELLQTFELLDASARPAGRARPPPSRRRAERAIGLGLVESPRGATLCAVEHDGRANRAPAPSHRLLRQLASRRARRRRQPAARLPADQQELRALLRLRRPLMLTLLRNLRRLRRDLALPAPDARPQPRPAPRRRRLMQRLRARTDTRCKPLRGRSALRVRHRRLTPARRRPARHRNRHDPHARAAPRRLSRHARTSTRRRARRLRTRRAASSPPTPRSSAPSKRFYRSTCAYPAAHPHRRRSHKRCSNCTTPATACIRTEQ